MNKLKKIPAGNTSNEKSKHISHSKNISTASSSEHISITTSSVTSSRIIQNFRLLWLDRNIDEVNNDECINNITKLRQIVNTVKTFMDINECIHFMNNIKDEKIFFIVSEEFSQTIIPQIQDIQQLNSIYILCKNKASHEEWARQWSKVKGVFTDITAICEALKQAVQECDQNLVSSSFFKMTDEASNQNLNQTDQSFIHRRILKEILLSIDFEQKHLTDFITYCRKQLAGNSTELKNIDKLQKKYRQHQPIWWYTSQCFLYSMLNRALRKLEVDLIIKMGFFIRDLHQHIAALHSEQYGGHHHSDSFTVYRAQGLSQTDFDQLMKTKGGLLSFNNFLFASKNNNASLAFARRTMNTSNLIGVLFAMKIDSSMPATPFANIKNISAYPMEEEILFSMFPIFRIGHIKQIDGNNRLWQVELILISDKDPQLSTLTESMHEATHPHLKGWDRLGVLLIEIGQLNKAQELYEIILEQTIHESEKARAFYQLGGIKVKQGDYTEAIASYKKSIKVNQKNLPPNHPNLAAACDKIALVYAKIGDYSQAISNYEKAIEIRQQTLPSSHPHMATSYNSIGSVYDSMGEYSKALSYYEKALDIFKKSLPPNHPHFATSYNNIGLLYDNMRDYSKALSSHEKALEIRQKTLPPNHPHMATSYNNIGLVHFNMGDQAKARSYYEKALEIKQKTLPPNHPDLATSYNNIGSVYCNMGDYSKALLSHEKALEIRQQTLHANHPDLAMSYGHLGMVSSKQGEHQKAVSYCELALKIVEQSLPPNHPNLQVYKKNLESAKQKL